MQLIQGNRWSTEARVQRTDQIVLAARRGALSDRHGKPLALTQETYHVGVAPKEVRDPERDAEMLARQLRGPLTDIRVALRKRYAYFAGPFTTVQVRPLRALRGVYLEPVVKRFYPQPDLGARSSAGWRTTGTAPPASSGRSTRSSPGSPAPR